MVHDVVLDPAALDHVVAERAAALAAHPPGALEMAKALCIASADSDAATSFRLEGIIQQGLIAQPDLAARFPAALAFIKAQLASAR
jgi:enoyl-CoA hydratase/carnithine racemase